MNITCIDAPPAINELELANLKTAASVKVKPPRVTASPVAFECCFLTSISFAPKQAILAGQIVHAYVEDWLVSRELIAQLNDAHLLERFVKSTGIPFGFWQRRYKDYQSPFARRSSIFIELS
jgi:flavin reductase (DIM6/NTAB) family NADH-FMN oxidoreductase RutF